MNLGQRDRRRRLELVAAEYVLGTLPRQARARLTRAALADPVVAAVIGEWERRLSGLADAAPAIAPPPRVWEAIARRLEHGAGTPQAGWWARVAFWRAFAIASFAGLLALGFGTLVDRGQPAGAIVVLLAGADAKPVLVATASRSEHALHVKAIGAIALPPDKALELWLLPDTGAPKSMGLVDPGRTVTLPLDTTGERFLAGAKGLAISLEPAGGSPTGAPTGPILYTGRIETI
jgi:anti-sigma-K factor RskA